jgi:hypothetical protein
MTVAARLHRRPSNGLMREIGRHHGRRAAKKPERIRSHKLVTQWQQLGDPLVVGFRKNGDSVPIQGAMQLRVGFAGRARSQICALLVSISPTLQSSGHGENPRKRSRVRRQFEGPNSSPTIHP